MKKVPYSNHWRPKDWENPYERPDAPYLTEKHLLAALANPKSSFEIYEKGADAMLQTLRANATESMEDGKLVLIPNNPKSIPTSNK